MGQAKCFACLTPHQQYILRTYLLALIAMGDTSITGVQALSAASTCFACLTYEELLAAKQYLMAVWLGLDTSKTGIISQVSAAACDFACLTPKQAEQLRTYLLAVTAGGSTTAAGVRTLEAAAKCFNCLESKQQLEAQVYLLSILAPGAPTTPAAIMQGAKCYLSCVPPELHEALQTSLFAQVTSRSTPPCVTPSAPSSVQATTARVADPTTQLLVRWLQPANSGTLVTGYTVFWGTTAGGPYTNNSGNLPAGPKQYTITGLTSGTTYFIVVRANTSISGCVSANSAETTATTSGSAPVDPAVTNWQTRVVANGGASPSAATLAAADTFWKGVKAAGLDTKIIHLNFIAPDSYIAAITPFIVGPGLDPWNSIQPLLAGDLGINGFTGNASKFMDTGCITSTIWAANNGALIVYDYNIAGAGAVGVLGSFNTGGGGGGGFFELNVGGTLFAGICDPNANLITHAAPVGNGYYCISRLNSTDERLYFANSTNPHAQIALQAGLQTAVFWAASNYFMALNTSTLGSAARQAPDTLSFAAIAQNWSATDDANMYPLVQALRTSLGGGFR